MARIRKILTRTVQSLYAFLADLVVLIICEIKKAIVGREGISVNLAGKVVLISGYDDSPLGKSLCDELIKDGCKVCVVKGPNISESPENSYCGDSGYKEYKTNIHNYNELKELKTSIENDFGSVDILVIISPNINEIDIVEACNSDFPKIIGGALKSMFLITKCFLDEMISKKSGQIIIVTPYCDKSDAVNILRRSVLGFAESLHAELLTLDRSFVSVTLARNYQFRDNPPINQNEAVSRIIKGIQKRDIIVDIQKDHVKNQRGNLFGDLLMAFLILLRNTLSGIFASKPAISISNRIALVTGSGMGIGKEIALRLARHGCNVAVADIDYEMAEQTANEIRKFNVRGIAYKADISNVNDIAELRTNIEKDMGKVDLLVNNAGLMPVADILKYKLETIDKIIDVNLISHLWTVNEFLPSMLESNYGHIVAISSMGGLAPLPLGTLYSTTKYGVVGFMDSLEYNLQRSGRNSIKTTTIHPYFTKTRNDLIELLMHDPLFKLVPWLETRYVGAKIVESIVNQNRRVIIPNFKWLLLLRSALPQSLRDLVTKSTMTSLSTLKSEGNILT